MKYNSFLFSLLLICIGCQKKTSSNDKSLKRINESYIDFKNDFEPLLITHFPSKITNLENSLSSKTNIERDDIGFYLYQYNLSMKHIDSLERHLIDIGFIEKYSSKEKCLFKVNAFETIELYKENEKPLLDDNSVTEKPCFKDKLPIPNFIDFQYDSKIDIWEDGSFDIYVFGAEKGLFYKGLELPSEQMPKEWGNGYSKGIAISREQKTVIYWMVIW